MSCGNAYQSHIWRLKSSRTRCARSQLQNPSTHSKNGKNGKNPPNHSKNCLHLLYWSIRCGCGEIGFPNVRFCFGLAVGGLGRVLRARRTADRALPTLKKNWFSNRILKICSKFEISDVTILGDLKAKLAHDSQLAILGEFFFRTLQSVANIRVTWFTEIRCREVYTAPLR